MKKIMMAAVLLTGICAASVCCAQNGKKVKGLKNLTDSVSYALGQAMYTEWQRQGVSFNCEKVSEALLAAEKGEFAFSEETINNLMQRFQAKLEGDRQAQAEKNKADGKAFIEKMRNNKSVYMTESGLAYQCKKKGNGKKPTATDKVKVHYTGKLIDGTVFDSSVERGEPITFPLNAVIAGWTEGLQLMDEGSRYILYIPSNLGYGDQTMGTIPAGSTLVFEVELLEINPQE
jgi:FKBP-type peptidyl-prolyl cis-trans isomerase